MHIGRALRLLAFCVVTVGIAFGVAVGAVALSGASSHAPAFAPPPPAMTPEARAVALTMAGSHIPVSDHGVTRGYVLHADLFGADASKPFLVKVYDATGAVVGYYGNLAGFVDTATAEAPGFDQVALARQRGVRACVTTDGPAGNSTDCVVGG
jgi:hypothetical protein